MTASNEITIHLPVFNNGKSVGSEALQVEDIGNNQLRLLFSPGFVEGLAAGDEIELSDENILGYQLIKRSGNLCVWFFFAHEDELGGVEAQNLCEKVAEIGGKLDGGLRSLIIFTIPVSAGFPRIENILNDAVKANPGSEWLFGNVYDPKDGKTPLNWW